MEFPISRLTKDQSRTFVAPWTEGNVNYCLAATVRHDDRCGNGHNTFSITGEIQRNRRVESCGCIHEDIAERLPELAPYLKWHLCSTDGPLHYVANTLYHVKDTDSNGLRKGERRQSKNRSGELAWHLPVRLHGLTYSESKPAPVEFEPYVMVGEGKERNLDAARSCAIWPEATDEELLSPDLEQKLLARLPKLMDEFKSAVEALGFTY